MNTLSFVVLNIEEDGVLSQVAKVYSHELSTRRFVLKSIASFTEYSGNRRLSDWSTFIEKWRSDSQFFFFYREWSLNIMDGYPTIIYYRHVPNK